MAREPLMQCQVLELRISWGRALPHTFFFNNFSNMAEFLSSKNPQYYCTTIPVESLVLACQNVGNLIERLISKQHLIIFKPQEKILRKAYLCDCNSCLQFDN